MTHYRLPTWRETARATLKATAILLTAYLLFAPGEANEARWQVVSLENLHDCRIRLSEEVAHAERDMAVLLLALDATLGRTE